MRAIYLSGKAGSGKTALALPIALKIREEGYRVSYFKPLGTHRGPTKQVDDDSKFMKEILQLKYSSKTISPLTITEYYLSSEKLEREDALLKNLDRCFDKVSQGADVVLIEGGITPFMGGSNAMDDFDLALRWNASMLHIIRADNDFEFDNSLIYLEYAQKMGLPSVGCIFNNTSDAQWNVTSGIYKDIVERKNVQVIGIMPRRRAIAAPTVNEFLDVLGGELLTERSDLNRPVENITIGTMTPESALSYLRRSPNKAVITGGDRIDMALSALETSTSVLILTGGLYPDLKVIFRAEEKGVPVVLVHHDTFTTVENLHDICRTINPKNEEAIRILKEDAAQYINFGPIMTLIREK
ncbi:MAG: phosphotransacetylase family protein [Firmicutes bacterium]|nr:phosphotransacetylase family protein [Bacillota bacterium]